MLNFGSMMAAGGGGGGGAPGAMERQRWADSKVYTRKSFKGLKSHISAENPQDLSPDDPGRFEMGSDDSSSHNRVHGGNMGEGEMQGEDGLEGVGLLRGENRVMISLGLKSKKERRELRRRLQGELVLVRNWVRKIDRNGDSRLGVGEGGGGGKLKRVHSEVGSIGGRVVRSSLDPLSILVVENSVGASNHVEKEKRTPKANSFYQSPDILVGKYKMQHPESNKKSKTNAEKRGEPTGGIEMVNAMSKIFKNCSSLLDRLMKHKHGWVFNKPVDVEGLGLHDYFNIIKHPMDLGTVKSRLNTNWYKFPKDFADDVRLTFQNALTYNPSGHDVHFMAEQLLKMFEDKWPSIEAEYLQDLKLAAEHEASLPTPTSRMAPPPPPPPSQLPTPMELTTPSERSASVTKSAGRKPKSNPPAASGRTPVPKKPKAKDPNKRDMTYEEKQKLSTSLQSLPSEKLDHVVQIIKKRNPSVCQEDDEIEVDIDSVDIETLWELDRFVMYYKKNLSKLKRKTELNQSKPDAEENATNKGPRQDKASKVAEDPKEPKKVGDKHAVTSPVRAEKQGNASKSKTKSSSGSDSGSSSSGGSKTDSSSA